MTTVQHIIKFFPSTGASLVLAVLAMGFFSCQSEQDELGEDMQISKATNVLTLSSAAAALMGNTANRDGSFDNIVDGASCLDIMFPYKVVANGLELEINSPDDLQVIEKVFDALDDDRDLLEIVFPITITTVDYEEIIVNGAAGLKELADRCKEGGEDADVECIDFVYPMTLFTFDVALEQTGSVVLEKDKDLRLFFNGLEEGDLVSIDYPISLTLYDATKIKVNSNEELVRTLEGAKAVCDEDDDTDFNDDDFSKTELEAYLVECPWLVRDVKRNEIDQMEQYFEYALIFSKDGTLALQNRQGNRFSGTWSANDSDNGAVLKLAVETLPDFTLQWLVYEVGDDSIQLYESEANTIRMQSACDFYSDMSDQLVGVLKECSWVIKGLRNNGEEVNTVLGHNLDFSDNGRLTKTDDTIISEGTWEIATNQEGRLVMAIVMGDEPGVSFEWLLSDIGDRYLKFNIEGTRYEIILVRNCDTEDDEDNDVGFIRNIFNDTEWNITYFEENGDETTNLYSDVKLYIDDDGRLEVRSFNGEVFSTGRWFAYRNAEFRLELILAFSPGSNYLPLANDYLMLEIEENRLELKHQNDGEGYDRLILER